jgi:DNA polymerase I-like protein with 3'-5' exonuclease and polymerase domains
VLQAIQEYAVVSKNCGTFVDGFGERTYPDGKVHPRWHCFVNGGRRASKEPNAQNMPSGKPALLLRGGVVGILTKDGTFSHTHTITAEKKS